MGLILVARVCFGAVVLFFGGVLVGLLLFDRWCGCCFVVFWLGCGVVCGWFTFV